MVFAEETVTESFIEEVKPLIAQHHDELGFRGTELDPDFNTYRNAGEFLAVFTARVDGALLGYSLFFVSHCLHHKQIKQALQDLLWLDPGYRKRGFGAEFLSWIDTQLKAKGVQLVLQSVRNMATHGALLEALGYSELERIYSRRIDG